MAGERIELPGCTVVTAEPIPLGHKVALGDVAPGAHVVKYGMPIGAAVRPIRAGALVHVHNIRSLMLVNDTDRWEGADERD
jgi:altronate hydrolase